MRSLKARFKYYQRRRPYLSDLVNFGRAVKEQEFTTDTIGRHIHLIPKEEYRGISHNQLLGHFKNLTRTRDYGYKIARERV